MRFHAKFKLHARTYTARALNINGKCVTWKLYSKQNRNKQDTISVTRKCQQRNGRFFVIIVIDYARFKVVKPAYITLEFVRIPNGTRERITLLGVFFVKWNQFMGNTCVNVACNRSVMSQLFKRDILTYIFFLIFTFIASISLTKTKLRGL
jgi:hypothetical protein